MAAVVLPTWIALGAVGLLCWPLGALAGASLPDRGYVVGKILGLWIIAALHWLLASQSFASTPALTLTLALALGAVLWAAMAGDLVRRLAREKARTWLALEGLFLLLLFAGAWLRAMHPAITWNPAGWGSEKCTDFAWFNALFHAGQMPPESPWMAGSSPNYYYFGHLVWALLFKITGFAPEVDYNLAMAVLFALTGLAVFLAAWSLTGARRWGVLALALAVVGGNVDPLLQFWRGWADGGGVDGLRMAWLTFDWWGSSRPIPGAINEFPAFSFLLGDLHAHVSALPLTLVAVMILLHLERVWRNAGGGHFDRLSDAAQPLALLAVGFGLLFVTNAWDVISLTILGAVAAVLGAWAFEWSPWRDALGRLGWLAVAAVPAVALAAAVFARGYSSPLYGDPWVFQFQGKEWPVVLPFGRVPVAQLTMTGDFLKHYGLVLTPLTLAALPGLWRRLVRLDGARLWFWAGAGAVFWLSCAYGMGAPLTGTLLLWLALALPVWARKDGAIESVFTATLVTTGVVLAIFCELFYLKDIFYGLPDARINTVFKLHYFIWTVWSLAAVAAWARLFSTPGPGAAAMGPWLRHWAGRTALAACLAVVLAVAALYPAAGLSVRAALPSQTPPEDLVGPLARTLYRLDGAQQAVAWGLDPDDLSAIRWLRDQHEGQFVVCEAAGPVYTEAGRLATYGGFSAPVAWDQHLAAWGGPALAPNLEYRRQVVEGLYTDGAMMEALEELHFLGCRYVYVGDLERRTYGSRGALVMSRVAAPAYQRGRATVYRLEDLMIGLRQPDSGGPAIPGLGAGPGPGN